jgi:Ca2+-transporting ATPase
MTAGAGRGLVIATGSETALGRVAGHLGEESPATPLQKQLGRLTARLGQAAVAIAVLVFAITLFRLGTGPETLGIAFMAAVALAVAAVPEGLPAVVTLSLAQGVRRMARLGAIVRNLPAVETLGSTTVLLTDKTGTLTQNHIEVASVLAMSGEPVDGLAGPAGAAAARVMSLCNDDTLGPARGDPVEVALLEAVGDERMRALRSRHPRVDAVPFDSERKMMSTLHAAGEAFELLTKGAPENVLALCRRAMTPSGRTVPLAAPRREELLAEVDRLASTGARMLLLATRDLDEPPADLAPAEQDLVAVALVVLRDPLRPEAARTVADMTGAGVGLVMVTGDHAGTASAVAHAAGLTHDAEEVRTGRQLHEDGVPEDLDGVKVYARVDPEQKLQLVEAYQAAGHVVAMTGDGVNDAPALQRADIGVAMGRDGSHVAREAADLIITSDDLDLLTRAMREGRAIYDNVRKVVDYLVAGNLSEVTVVLAGLSLFPGLGIPLLPLQLLWINLLTDGLPALALGFDHPHPDVLNRPRTGSQLLSGRRLWLLAGRGVLIAAGAVAALVAVRGMGGSWDQGRTAMFTALVIAHLLYVFVVRLPAGGGTNHRLLAAVGIGLVLQMAAVLGPLAGVFGTAPLSPAMWAATALAGVTPVAILAVLAAAGRRDGRTPPQVG